ncbi:eukaryotic translation initiation factor 4 gamma 1a isoform X2 [Gadus macrocephalus]|uniref:eukaryotic translation initiation factor 4 gamma 1a isoform X2 n=1 Tax=Gadus macrocephalus TaxID=80720 RepID=UPI0028CB8C43|nr:eukaryotic translation initiation factor 4 gamma 1a isoform X2 [Gadus macrocephalus]
MNKPPQPITGPVSVPHPAPSPGLTQAGYAPGQPPSLVFANPPLPQMNPAPQPRQFAAGPRALHQQPYYPNRPTMPTSAPRVQTSSGPRPVGPTHVYPAGSQMMMIPQQQISFPGSPQGYFIPPGQYRPQYMAPTQQYPVTAGTAGFFPGTSPAEYPGFEPSHAARERRGGGGRGGGRENGRLSLHGTALAPQRYPAGAYYPAQPQFTQSVQPAPVIISPAQQPQQAPPPQQPPAQPQGPPKRERIPIRIRDPNQGGKDITEEIMSGGRATSTPTPPQASSDSPVLNGDVTQTIVSGTDESTESAASVETPPPASASPVPEVPLETVTPELVPAEPLTKPAVAAAVEAAPPLIEEQKQQQPPAPAVLPPPSPPPAAEPEPEAEVSDTVDAPVPPPAASAAKRGGASPVAPPAAERTPEKKEEKPEVAKKSEPEKSTVAKLKKEPAAGPPAPVTPSSATAVEAAVVPPVKASSAPPVKASSAPPVKAAVVPPVKASSAPPVKASSAPPMKAAVPPPVKAAVVPPVKAAVVVPPVKAAVVVPPVKAAVVVPPVKAAVVVPPVKAAVVVPPVKAAVVVPPVKAAVVPPVEAAVPPPVKAAVPPPVKAAVVVPPVEAAVVPPVKAAVIPPPEVKAAVIPPVKAAKAAPEPALEPQASTEEAAAPPSELPAAQAETPLSNGLAQGADEASEDLTPEVAKPVSCQPPEASVADPAQEKEAEEEEEVEELTTELTEEASAALPAKDSTMQAAMSVPKKKRNMKELNKKATGDLLDAFKEEQAATPVPEPSPVQAEPAAAAPAAAEKPASEAVDETWEEKEDKQNPKPVVPKTEPAEQKYQYKEENWKPINPEDKKQYDRVFLLGCQFITASMHKPEGLPLINEVILDKANATPMRPADPARVMNVGPDFTPSYLGNLGSRQSTGGPGPGPRGPPPGPRRSQQGQRKEPRKIIITSMSLNNEVQLNKAEKAWKPGVKKAVGGRGAEEGAEEDDPEEVKTQELFKRVRSVLNKLTPQMFQALMKQVTDMSIDTEARLKGVIDLIFEKAISEPNFSVAYANMCRCLMGLKVPTTDNPEATVNFRKLLLNRCQKEFEKDQDDDVIFEKKQKELEASKDDEERDRLKVELQASKDKARRRSLGNIKFIGELFKLKMLTEAIMHDCVVKLLKNHDEESLECLCRLLATIGKDLDFEKAKPRMEQYFAQLDKIIKERKTSSRIRFMLLDVIDLRRCKWVPRRGEQGPKTIEQIHKDAEAEEHREQIKVQQQMLSKKDGGGGGGGGGGGRMGGGGGGGNMGGRGHHAQGGGRGSQVQDEGWNTVPISKGNRPIDTTRFSKIINKPGAQDVDDQRLAPGGRGFGNWTKGSSGGTGSKAPGAEQESGRPATSTVNRFSALQQSGPPSGDADRRVPQRSSSSRDRGGERDRNDRGFDRFERREGRDGGGRPTVTKRSFSRESQERGGDGRGPTEPVRRVSSMTDDRVRRDRAASKEPAVKPGRDSTPPPAAASKPALSEEEMDKKSNAIIEEYIHINDLKEALQCVSEMNSASLLFVFVRNGVESTLERSPPARAHLGHLMHQLIKAGTLPPAQYYKGLQETLEMAEDMAIDVPHIWQYLAEQIVPMLQEGGIPMEQLFREISKPLVPLGMAGVLLAQILTLLCKGMTHKKVGAMWNEAGLNWSEFLSKDVDVNKFVTEQHLEFTLDTEGSEGPEKKPLTNEEISKQLERLIQDKAENQRIIDWVEANLDAQQSTGNSFVRALMTSVCQSAIICDNLYKVDGKQISERGSLLLKYLSDEPKELQALYALQALMVHMEQPANLLRMFFDNLYDEDVIKEETFYKWESSKDPAEQTGKGVALKSVTTFFTWLREAEEESDKE